MKKNSKVMQLAALVLISVILITGCGKTGKTKDKSAGGTGGTETTAETGTTVESATQLVKETTGEVSTETESVSETTGEVQTETESVPETAPEVPSETETGVEERFQVDLDYLATLPNEGTNWGQGTTFDEYNRPVYSIQAQERNGQYDALFIMPQENKLYITMDCGSSSTYMTQILDTLKEKQVSVTFFVTLPFAQNNPDVILRMIQEGHKIGNHSVTHPSNGMFSLSIEEQIQEVQTVHDYLLQNYGYEMDVFRYPQGTYSTQSLALMQQLGYRSVFWSFAYMDYDENNQPEPEYAISKLKDRVHPGAIYLLHVDSKTNADILGEFIDAVRSMGYELSVLS